MTVVTVSGSKPQAVAALRSTWRQSAEHKAAQVKRFLGAMAAVVVAQLVGDVAAGKNPMTHFTDLRTAWYYLLPFAYVAWRQVHPAMTASQIDSAPGATIVPSQVGLPSDAPAPPVVAPEPPQDDVVTSYVPDGVDTTPTGDGPPAEGDAAP